MRRWNRALWAACTLLWPAPAEAQTLPPGVAQFIACNEAIIRRLAIPDNRLLPILPGAFQQIDLAAAGDALAASRPLELTEALGPVDITLEGQALRDALEPNGRRVEKQVERLEHMLGQVQVLSAGETAAGRLAARRQAHLAYLQQGLWPDQRSFALLVSDQGPSACAVGTGNLFDGMKAGAESRYGAYRYGEDYRIVLAAYDRRARAPRTALPEWFDEACSGGLDGGLCAWNLQYAFKGFYTVRREAQAQHRERLTAEQLSAFFDTADWFEATMVDTRSRFASAYVAARVAARGGAAAYVTALGVEASSLSDRRAALDEEQGALQVLSAAIAERQARDASLSAAIAATRDRRDGLLTTISAARTNIDALEGRIATRDEEIDATDRRIADLVLDCGGVTYDDCPDQSARDRYDEALFRLYEILRGQTETLFTLYRDLDVALSGLDAALDDLEIAREALDVQVQDRTDLLLVQADAVDEELRRRTVWTAQDATWRTHHAGHRRDGEALARLMGIPPLDPLQRTAVSNAQ